MKKLLSLIVLLAISSVLSFGQNYSVKSTGIKLVQDKEAQGMDQYMSKYAPSSTKAIIWSSEMSNTTDWTVSNASDATISTMWTRLADTSAASANWKDYVGPYMGSATPMNGVYYFEGISNLINGNYGISNSRITNSIAINTTGHPGVVVKFYQLYKGFNYDSTLLEISNDNVNWKTIDVNPLVTANQYSYGWKEINVTPWAGNKASVYVRFRFWAPAVNSTGGGAGSGGYGWMIDDVSLIDADDNKLVISKQLVTDAYTEIPFGQQYPISFEALANNIGGKDQLNVKLTGKEINTNTVLAGPTLDTIASATIDTVFVQDFFTPTVVGEYKITSWLTSDAIPEVLLGDTFNLKVTTNEILSRDNNYYYSSKWNDGDPYAVANLFEVKTNDTVFGIKIAVNLATKVGAQIRGVLYKGSGAGGGGADMQIVASSDYYEITAQDIPVNTGSNPTFITLPFTAPYLVKVDSIYWGGMSSEFGGDTVKIAIDNSLIAHSGGIPQNHYTSILYDNTTNKWYVWTFEQQAAMIIRLSFDHTLAPIVGINEVANDVNLFSCMPNPANNSTKISYELKNTQKVSILVTDITGRIVMTLNEGTKTSGNYAVDADLTSLTSGTYFYTLKTETNQVTKKLIIVKR